MFNLYLLLDDCSSVSINARGPVKLAIKLEFMSLDWVHEMRRPSLLRQKRREMGSNERARKKERVMIQSESPRLFAVNSVGVNEFSYFLSSFFLFFFFAPDNDNIK